MTEEFGQYVLQDLLGRGGMGEVYRAFDTVKGRTVALKLLPAHLAADESFQARFRRESRMAARLNEAHVIPIHDFGEIDGRLFLDMRLVEGADLGTILGGSGPLPAPVAVGIVGQVASALDAAHNGGLVHRDVKPSNVIVTGMDVEGEEPFAYLVDFGIARALPGYGGTALTATTSTVGTLAYMAPERIGGDPGDHRADVYSLACVLYECLTGVKPFDGEMFAIMYAHVNSAPPTVSSVARGTPSALDDVVTQGMAKNPADRFATAGLLARAARSALSRARTETIRRPPPEVLSAPFTPPPPSPGPPVSGPVAAPVTGPPLWARPAFDPPPSQTVRRGDVIQGPPPFAPPPFTPPPFTPPPFTPPPFAPPPPGPPSHPSGPVPLGAGAPAAKSRRGVLIGLLALIVIAAVVVAVVLVNRGGSSTATATSSTPSVPATAATTAPTPAPTVPGSWSDFSGFTQLVGDRAGDTAGAFKGATCALKTPDATIAGLVSQIECRTPTDVYYRVDRFSTGAAVTAYVTRITTDQQYAKVSWMTLNLNRGLELTAPSTATFLDITSTICALPTFLVQFSVPNRTTVTLKALHDDYWAASQFPNTTPAACPA